MEEQFILRVPPSVAERIERLLNDPASSSEDKSMDLSFSEDGRSGTFIIGNDHFSTSLLDLPTVVESYKTYDDNVLIKTADIGQTAVQIIMVREDSENVPESVEYRHGLTPPMRDARRRRFRREPDLNPEVVRRVEKDLQNIMAGGTVENIDILFFDTDTHTLSPILYLCVHVPYHVLFVGVMMLQCMCSWKITVNPSYGQSPFLCLCMHQFPFFSFSTHRTLTDPNEYDENSRSSSKKSIAVPLAKPIVPEAGLTGREPDGSDSDDTDDSI
ncbi:transcription initiation factor TFIID subunit 7 [Dorcoceras hygrometricum]|uniref:Transcription initiation factor TFIID subunit 7 n=1 Tax=Dorcoceras hygrometricum TaxID=472368 RepID=A0A2Z7A4Y3_9LAMI|nr:transcription initiation factor TFIID subunit 7 [Dorcoceras hygrometricum]